MGRQNKKMAERMSLTKGMQANNTEKQGSYGLCFF